MESPPDGGRRVPFLDALRGVAILGILPVNAAFFAYPAALADDPGYPEGGGFANALCLHAVRLLFESKFLTIFAFLFGAGMHILRTGAAERGERWTPLILRRLVFLWVLGCLHGVLVWYGDILAYYALLGIALCWTPGRPPGTLRRWGLILLAVPLLPLAAALVGVLAGSGWATAFVSSTLVPSLPDGRTPGWEPGAWHGFGQQLVSLDPDFEIAVYRTGTFAQVTVLRGATWAGAALFAGPFWGPRMAGLMLLGMAAAAEGWLLDPGSAEGRRRFDRLLRIGLAVGLPCSVAAVVLRDLAPRDPAFALGAELSQYAGSLGLSGVLAALVARGVVARPGAAWVRAASAVGRMALSHYLLQSAAMTLLFYGTTVFAGAGLGLFALPGRPLLLALCAALLVLQVTVGLLWLRAFRAGPVEWCWRSVTHLRRGPLRRGEEG